MNTTTLARATQLGEAGFGRAPVMDRDARHRRVDGVVIKRKRLARAAIAGGAVS